MNFGFNVTKGSCLTTLDPMTDNQRKRLTSEMKRASERFYKGLISERMPAPSFFRLMLFRLTRTCLKNFSTKYRDYYYYKENGWFESDYYHHSSIGPVKKAAGMLFDMLGRVMVKHM